MLNFFEHEECFCFLSFNLSILCAVVIHYETQPSDTFISYQIARITFISVSHSAVAVMPLSCTFSGPTGSHALPHSLFCICLLDIWTNRRIRLRETFSLLEFF